MDPSQNQNAAEDHEGGGFVEDEEIQELVEVEGSCLLCSRDLSFS